MVQPKKGTQSAQPKKSSSNSGNDAAKMVGSVARPSRTGDEDKYYIYASTSGKSPSPTVKVLESGTPTDKFVASLNKDQVLVLATKPKPTASLDSSDPTRQWLTNLDAAVGASLTLDTSTNIQEFGVQFKAPWPLTFSSAADVLLFTFGAGPPVRENATSARIHPPGLDAHGLMLTCGLDFTKTGDITGLAVKDLFNHAGIASMVDLLPSGIADMPVTLPKPQAGDKPKRNALWFVPSRDLQTTIRLQFQLTAFDKLQHILGSALKGFTLQSADAIYSKRTVLAATEKGLQPLSDGKVAFSVECSVQADKADAPVVSMTAGVEFGPSGISLTLLFTSEKPLSGILQWLAGLIGDDNLEKFVKDMLDKAENGTKIFPDANLRRLSLGLGYLGNKDEPVLASLGFDIEVTANFGRGSSSKAVVFLVSYHWSRLAGGSGTLAGQLWNSFNPSHEQDLLPGGELWTILQPVTRDPAISVDVASLIPTQEVINIPDTLPSSITRAYVSLSDESFAVGGTVSAVPPSADSVPQPYLGQVALNAAFSWGKSSTFSFDVSIMAGITPSQVMSAHQTPAVLRGSLSYRSKTWVLQASITGLYASTLAAFFNSDWQPHVAPLLESIAIDTLSVEYKYQSIVAEGAAKGKSAASEFTIQGNLLIAQLELGLFFHTEKNHFNFYATVNPEDKEATIGDVLTGILGHDGQLDLPDFVADMKLVAKDKDVFRIDVEEKKQKQTGMAPEAPTDSFLFLAQFKIAELSFTFAQLHSSDWGLTAPSKRLIEVAISSFPDLEVDIPLVGTIKQPLDELYFLWVQDPPVKAANPNDADAKPGGLTRKDLAQLNSGLKDAIIVKDKFKEEEKKPTNLMVGVGCHFAVIVHDSQGNRSCLLDYDFMKPKQSTEGRQAALMCTESDDDEGGHSAQAPYKKKTGPLSISNVGLKYKGKRLAIMFDATFDMGPISFSLLGFSLRARFKTLDQLPRLDVDIQGLSAAFSKSPLTIEGIIRHGNDGGLDYYAGGLIVGFEPWKFEAAGFYGIVTPSAASSKPSFRSIFIFARLEGPLVTLEFAEITGITGGFGYNSSVRVPTADQIYEFPFISTKGLEGSALDVLQKLTDPGPAGWFQPLDKTYWAAVGLKVDAFQMISIDAVLVVQFGAAIRLSLYALALADIPSAKSDVKFAHVELGISAVADLTYGTLKIEAQLSPRSFILYQDCHLTGGAGLYYWFDAPLADSSKTGNFVFTLGGYHEAFDVPLDYPKPPRLGISWILSNNLSITGQAYFAITPNACMGGGRLHASFSAGPVGAWFDAFADFLINYKPFHFIAQAGLAVGVSFNVDFLFIHIHISCEISAQIYLWGPPVAGRVHVDFWVFGFDIDFGQSQEAVKAVPLLQFYLLVLQASSQTSSSMFSPSRALLAAPEEAAEEEEQEGALVPAHDTRPKNEGHVFMATSGLMNPGDKTKRPPNEPWTVKAGIFSFTIRCKMAINQVKLDPQAPPIIIYGDPQREIDVYSRAMHLESPMTSILIVQTTQDGKSTPDVGWRFDAHVMAVPKGLWAKYDRRNDPLSGGGNNIKDLLNGSGGSMSLMMGVDIMAPKAIMSPDPFPPFITADASLQKIDADKLFPDLVNSATEWEPGKPYPDREIEKQYDAVYDKWVTPTWGTGADGQKGFVGGWAKALSWNVSAMSDIASIPEMLKRGFKNLYVAPPLLCGS